MRLKLGKTCKGIYGKFSVMWAIDSLMMVKMVAGMMGTEVMVTVVVMEVVMKIMMVVMKVMTVVVKVMMVFGDEMVMVVLLIVVGMVC